VLSWVLNQPKVQYPLRSVQELPFDPQAGQQQRQVLLHHSVHSHPQLQEQHTRR
jgi:hypothetical protein